MAGDDLDLKTLSDDELVPQMHDDLYDGLAEEIVEGTEILLERGWAPDKVLNDALVEGMRIVGVDFRDGILFGSLPSTPSSFRNDVLDANHSPVVARQTPPSGSS